MKDLLKNTNWWVKKNNIHNSLKLRQLPVAAIVLFIAGLLFSGCKKPENDLGLNVQPEEDALGLNQTDTLSLITYTLLEDSVRGDELTVNLAGSYMDRDLGKVSAAMGFQILTAAQNITFLKDSITIDSVVLSLKYSGYYGNLNSQTFRVYRITEQLYVDSSYYFDQTISYDNSKDWVESGYGTFTPDPFSTMVVGTDTAAPAQLRLKLSNELGDTLLGTSTTNLATPEAFVGWFNGLLVVPDNPVQGTEQGAILYFDLVDSYSKLTVYYRENEGAGIVDTTSVDFPITSSSARFTSSTFGHASAGVNAYLTDTTRGMERFHIQTMSGLKGAIQFPWLDNLKGLPVVINKAELVLPVEYYSSSSYYPISRLFLVRTDEYGNEETLPDLNEGDAHAGGYYDNTKKEYRFLITRYVQQILYNKLENTGLRVLSTEAGVSGNRVILSGPSSDLKRQPRLILTFSTY